MNASCPRTKLLAGFCAAGLVWLAGCVNPQHRIEQNPAAFARCTPEQQELIKQGRVAVGFDEEMVKLAVGDPDKIYERIDAGGKSETWVYTIYQGYDGMMYYRGWYHRGFGPGGFYPYYLDYPNRQELERLRIVLRGGKVESVEHLAKE